MSFRVAFENLLDDALDLTATNVDNDSSVNNLWHPYLEHAMNCTKVNSLIIGRFTEAKKITCIAVAYHTGETVLMKLYDSEGAEVHSQTINLEAGDAIYYMEEAIENVFSFSLYFESGENISIGYIYLGQCHEFPSIKREGAFSYDFTGDTGQSTGGQRYGVFGSMLRVATVEIPYMTGEQRAMFAYYLSRVQNVKPHMIDLFPDSHEQESSMYCTVNSNLVGFKKRWEPGFFYSVPLEWKEAR